MLSMLEHRLKQEQTTEFIGTLFTGAVGGTTYGKSHLGLVALSRDIKTGVIYETGIKFTCGTTHNSRVSMPIQHKGFFEPSCGKCRRWSNVYHFDSENATLVQRAIAGNDPEFVAYYNDPNAYMRQHPQGHNSLSIGRIRSDTVVTREELGQMCYYLIDHPDSVVIGRIIKDLEYDRAYNFNEFAANYPDEDEILVNVMRAIICARPHRKCGRAKPVRLLYGLDEPEVRRKD